MDQDAQQSRPPKGSGQCANVPVGGLPSAQPFSPRYAATVLLLMVAALPVIWLGVVGALASNSNDPRQWLPRGFDETEKYVWFQDHFGRDEVSVVSWPGCTLEDPRVDRLADLLTAPPAQGDPAEEPCFFQRAITGPRIFRQLTSSPLGLTPAEALRRLRGTLVGPDGRTTCLVLVLAAAGEGKRADAVERIRRVAETKCGLTRDELRLGGPTVDAATIDVESQHLLLHLAGVSAAIAFLVTLLRLGSFRLAVIVLLGAIYTTGAALSVLYFSGGTMNLLTTMLPPLIYVLSISAGVHLVNYYRDAVDEGDPAAAPRRAVAYGWVPCVLAATTTAIGLVSLARSQIVPIRTFGVYSAVGMLVSLIVLFLFLPAALTLWPLRPAAGGRLPSAKQEPTGPTATVAGMTSLIRRFHGVLTGVCLALMVGLGWGLGSIQSTVKLQHRFSPHSRVISDYRWLEEHLGPLVPLEVVVHFGPECSLDFLGQMEFVAGVEREIAALPDVGATMSAVDFAPPLPDGASAGDVVRRRLLARRLPRSRDRYVDAHFLAAEGGEQLWRISVRAEALSDVDYGRFVEVLRQHVDPLLKARPGGHVKATYTGVIPLIYKAQRVLFNDLFKSFLTAFFVIALVMVVALRSVSAGLLAMVPNVFPAVVIFGFMGWAGLLIEIGSVMTASAALGIAVDDTFHFLTWFRRGVRQGMSRHDALRFAYQRCAGAMLNTTVICGSGLVIFVLSTFMPIVHFAWLMVALLVAALLGDLVLLPAMLAGPLGKVFQRGILPGRRVRRGG